MSCSPSFSHSGSPELFTSLSTVVELFEFNSRMLLEIFLASAFPALTGCGRTGRGVPSPCLHFFLSSLFSLSAESLLRRSLIFFKRSTDPISVCRSRPSILDCAAGFLHLLPRTGQPREASLSPKARPSRFSAALLASQTMYNLCHIVTSRQRKQSSPFQAMQ